MLHDFDGREYKILLNPAKLTADPSDIADFYADRLEPLLAKGGGRTVEGAFNESKERMVWFLDTPDLALNAAGLSLRHRRNGGDGDIDLKLRLPDLFIVAGTDLRATDAEAKIRFEEDIAPLEAMDAGGALTIADPPSIRSRFSLSGKQALRDEPATLGDAFALFPTLQQILGFAGLDAGPSTPLIKGPVIAERVFEGPRVTFRHVVESEVSLTLWTLEPGASVENVAEISYRCRTPGGRMPVKAAREALELFLLLQRELDVELRYPSKTKLALPRRGGAWATAPDGAGGF